MRIEIVNSYHFISKAQRSIQNDFSLFNIPKILSSLLTHLSRLHNSNTLT
jgi:hypothetical protein